MTKLMRLLRDNRGFAAVEFALFTPVFGLLLAGTVDLGGALYTKFKLDSAVSAGANYAMVNAANAGSAGGQAMANSISTIVETSEGTGWADNTVVVNNGPSTAVSGGGTPSTSGTASNADACYCPTGTGSNFAFGNSTTCGNACTGTNTGFAGKYVTISATRAYSPIFSSYGIVANNTITVTTAVQVQ
jgi:Flp pilus assembly protein TadG